MIIIIIQLSKVWSDEHLCNFATQIKVLERADESAAALNQRDISIF